ncbi:hypothetical protein [Phaeovulum sp. NW3]|uniref:hypothetical protein n=1 Tax=Phaeovulum sp. NW3 TaxID=2934933 RepID=UPI00201FC410|nr:hypothetical protein [Phaeovulum sp. NW3]MCL7466346.1 hypothetical protein [Phaeovulum sp. NW3]
MIELTVYDAATGEIRRVLRGPQIEELTATIGPDEAVLPGALDAAEVYIVADQPVAYPPRPGPWAVFDYAACLWIDPRTEADLAAALEATRRAAIRSVNAACGAVRARFVTQLPGQEMIYLRKEAEARAFIADPAPDLAAYPFISAEVGITPPGGTALHVAQTYLAMSAQWQAIGAALEQIRLGSIGQIEAAATEAAITAALSAVQTALEGFAP